MAKELSSAIVLFTMLAVSFTRPASCDIEYTSLDVNAQLFDGDEDSLKMSNQKTLNCDNNSAALWRFLRDRVDTNNDSVIDLNELNSYILKRIKKLHQEELGQQINRLDVNKTGLIDFKVYIRDAFDNLYDSAILEEEALSSSALPLSTKTQAAASISNPLAPKSSANDDEFKELKDLYKFEKDKWTFVAERPSDTLTYLQFYMFVYSEEYAEVLDFEARVNFAKFDTNADGFISVDEFLVNVHDVDHTMVSVKKRKFSKSLDLDQDNQIELAEFKKWYMPSIEQLVSEELASLIDQCDTDQNQQLAEAEVVKCCRALLNSQLTNYGIDLNPPSQIAQRDFKFNDEL